MQDAGVEQTTDIAPIAGRSNSRQIRVLLVSPVGIHGGAEQVLLALAKHLPRFGVEPIIACLRPGPLVELARNQGLSVYAFTKDYRYRNLWQVARAIRWLYCLAQDLKVDVLHSNFTAHLLTGVANWYLKLPEIWHLYDFPHRKDLLCKLMERLPTDYVIFTLEKLRNGFTSLNNRPYSVIPATAVEPGVLKSSPAVDRVREHFDLPSGPLFLTVARLQAHKGHRHLIDAIPLVLARHPDAVFAIAGKANGKEQERYASSLLEQAKRLNVESSLRFLGYVRNDELVALRREATALVHPAESEGFGPLALIEAMVLGTPVIAAAADGPRELLSHGNTGLLVPVRDSASLAQAVVSVIEDPRLRERIAVAGEQFAVGLSAAAMAKATALAYRKAVGGSIKDDDCRLMETSGFQFKKRDKHL